MSHALHDVGPEHAEVLAAIHREAFARPWDADSLRRSLSHPTAWGLMAAPAEEPQGFVICWRIGADAEILTIAVRPAARRLGLGRALTAAALESAQLGGAERMLLEVAEDNGPARALYLACGFEEVSRRRGYYTEGQVDALVLARILSGKS